VLTAGGQKSEIICPVRWSHISLAPCPPWLPLRLVKLARGPFRGPAGTSDPRAALSAQYPRKVVRKTATVRQAGLEALGYADFRCSDAQGGVINGAFYGGWICDKRPRRHALQHDIGAATSPASGIVCQPLAASRSCARQTAVAVHQVARSSIERPHTRHAPSSSADTWQLHSAMKDTPQCQSDRHLPTSAAVSCFGTNLRAAAAIAGEYLFIRPSPSQLPGDVVPSWTGVEPVDLLPEAAGIADRDPRRTHYVATGSKGARGS
jgi:hypothetical protein